MDFSILENIISKIDKILSKDEKFSLRMVEVGTEITKQSKYSINIKDPALKELLNAVPEMINLGKLAHINMNVNISVVHKLVKKDNHLEYMIWFTGNGNSMYLPYRYTSIKDTVIEGYRYLLAKYLYKLADYKYALYTVFKAKSKMYRKFVYDKAVESRVYFKESDKSEVVLGDANRLLVLMSDDLFEYYSVERTIEFIMRATDNSIDAITICLSSSLMCYVKLYSTHRHNPDYNKCLLAPISKFSLCTEYKPDYESLRPIKFNRYNGIHYVFYNNNIYIQDEAKLNSSYIENSISQLSALQSKFIDFLQPNNISQSISAEYMSFSDIIDLIHSGKFTLDILDTVEHPDYATVKLDGQTYFIIANFSNFVVIYNLDTGEQVYFDSTALIDKLLAKLQLFNQ